MKIYFYLGLGFLLLPLNTYAIMKIMVDTEYTVKIEGEGFDGHEALEIEDGECYTESIYYGSGFFTEDCILHKLGKKRLTVYDTTYGISIEVSEEYQTVQGILVDKENPSAFHMRYGWWVDYMRKGNYLQLARQARKANQAQEIKAINEVMNALKNSGIRSPVSTFNAKNQITSIVIKSMQEYYKTLSPYVIPAKRQQFHEFVMAATQEDIAAYSHQVDEIVSR